MSGPRLMALAVCCVIALALSAAAAAKQHHAPVKKTARSGHGVASPDAGHVAPQRAAPKVDVALAQGAARQAALVARGLELYRTQVCYSCHSTDGAVSTGPTFLGLYGKQQKLRDGSTVTVDDAYVRESLMNPGARVADGFLPLMPSYSGRLEDADVEALLAWLKTVK